MSLFTSGNMPGHTAAITSESQQPYFGGRGGETLLSDYPAVIVSTSTDTGNTDLTTTLRGGLVMTQLSTGKFSPYIQSTEGRVIGVLPHAVNMLVNGTAADRFTSLFVSGRLRASEIPNLDYYSAGCLVAQGFHFDNPLYNCPLYGINRTKWITSVPTLVAADHGTRYMSATALAIVMPALSAVSNGWTIQVCSTGVTTIAGAASAADLIWCNASDVTGTNNATTITATDLMVTITAKYVTPQTGLIWVATSQVVPAAAT